MLLRITTPQNLPHFNTSLVGREADLAQVQQLLHAGRLVTIIGPGGIGKTRLAVQVARSLRAEFPDGLWLVELATLADDALVWQALAAGLGVREARDRPVTVALSDYLRAKHLLLILDSCERVSAACAAVAEALLSTCPHLKILISSRAVLRTPSETVYRLPTLAAPTATNLTPETLVQSPAAQLFVERAQVANPAFALTLDNAPLIAEICQRLDGIPLALELAAARTKTLTIEQIDSQLRHSFWLLTGGSQTNLPRQKTLRALIDWSYELLTDAERCLLRRLGVFAGGWTLTMAEQVCAGSSPASDLNPGSEQNLAAAEIVDLHTQLENRSLISREPSASSEGRYRQLEIIRQYAQDQLHPAGEVEWVHQQLLTYFLHWLQTIEPQLAGPAQLNYLEQLEIEHENLRFILTWALAQASPQALALLGLLGTFWEARGYLSEMRHFVSKGQRLITKTTEVNATQAKVLLWAGALAFNQRDFAQAQECYQRSLALYQQLHDKAGVANVSWRLANVLQALNQPIDAQQLYESSLNLYWDLQDENGAATVLSALGLAAREQGDFVQAKALLEESLALYQTLGNRLASAHPLRHLGLMALLERHAALAVQRLEESLALSRAMGDKLGIAYSLGDLGRAVMQLKDYPRAQTLLEESLTLAMEMGDLAWAAYPLNCLGLVALRQGDYARAYRHLRESLEAYQWKNNRSGVAECLDGLGLLAAQQWQLDRAASLHGAAEQIRSQAGLLKPADEELVYDQTVSALQTQLGPKAFETAWLAGRAMNWEQALAFALGDYGSGL